MQDPNRHGDGIHSLSRGAPGPQTSQNGSRPTRHGAQLAGLPLHEEINRHTAQRTARLVQENAARGGASVAQPNYEVQERDGQQLFSSSVAVAGGSKDMHDFSDITGDGAAYEDGTHLVDFRETEHPGGEGEPEGDAGRGRNEETLEEVFRGVADTMMYSFEGMSLASTQQGASLRGAMPCACSGEDHEDPVWFVGRIAQIMDENGILDDLERIYYVTEQLKGKAKRWYEANIQLMQSYDEMIHLFLEQFNGFTEVCGVRRRLQGELQPADESAVAFITRKRRMCERVMPGTPFSEAAMMIIDQLEPELGMRVSARNYENFNDLMRWAKYYEERLKYAVRTNSIARYRPPARTQNTSRQVTHGNATTAPSSNAGSSTDAAKTGPPSRCKFCGEWHFHRDCPKNPYRTGNAERAERTAPSAQNQPQKKSNGNQKTRTANQNENSEMKQTRHKTQTTANTSDQTR